MPQILPPLAELSVFGIYIEPALPALLAALAITDLLRRAFHRAGINRKVWNWPLFMFALYTCLAAAIILVMPGV
jgi:hypothetical protein